MRHPLSSLARPVLALALVSSTAALVLARLAPAERGWRTPSETRYASVNAFYLDQCRRGSIWVDRDGGPPLDLGFGENELLEYASCSPWRDEQGHSQIVGRWSWNLRSGSSDTSYGLARFSLPDGELLDHVETDVVPVSSPCWYPGTRARVLFAAGDGMLYQYNFEAAESGDGRDGRREAQPHPLTWNCAVPGGDGVFLSEPNWPSDPRFSHLLFVGLRKTVTSKARLSSTSTQIWWLRLSDDGGSIDEAGLLLEPSADGEESNYRCPTFGEAPGGRPVLAYYRRHERRSSELYVVPIDLDPESRCPRTASAPGSMIADRCLTSPPFFSRDGRWISVVQGIGGDRGVVRRIPLALGTDAVASLPSPSALVAGAARR